MSTTSTALGDYLWTFDSTFEDTSSTFRGEPINCPSFSASTITGYGSSLSLIASMSQFLSVTVPSLPLFDRSWTFEVWIYLFDVLGSTDYLILGQCDSFANDRCLHLVIRNRKILLGFYSDDLGGVTDLIASRWYHTAFVFDTITRTQSVHLWIITNQRTSSTEVPADFCISASTIGGDRGPISMD